MIEEGSEKEDKSFVRVYKNKDKNKEIHFETVRKDEYICVEIPGRIKKGSNGLSAVESLGGLHKITEVFNHHKNKYNYDETIVLRINNNDMYSSFISATCTKVNNILIKIKRTRKNNYKFEFLGFVKYFYYFNNMSDFYYIPSFYNRYDYNTNYIHLLQKGKTSQKKKNINTQQENKDTEQRKKKKKKKKKKNQKNENIKDVEKQNEKNDPNQNYQQNICDINLLNNDNFFLFNNNNIYNSTNNTQNINTVNITNMTNYYNSNQELNKIIDIEKHNINQNNLYNNLDQNSVNNNNNICGNPCDVRNDPIYYNISMNSSQNIMNNKLTELNANTGLPEFSPYEQFSSFPYHNEEMELLYKQLLDKKIFKDDDLSYDNNNNNNNNNNMDRERSYSSDESEAFELHCSIHSKCINPYDYKSYESHITNKYIREYKHIISKFSPPINSKEEIKQGDLEFFLKGLIHTTSNDLVSNVSINTTNDTNNKNDHVGNINKYNHNYDYNHIIPNVNNSNEDHNQMDPITIDDLYNEENNLMLNKKSKNEDINNYSNKIIVTKKPVHCNPIAKYDDEHLPINPFESALKKYVSDELYNRVKLLFEIRPIWCKDVLLEHVENISTYCLKSCFSKICFYFADGPWRRTYCKYGYDPRKDPTSYIYQTIDFRYNLSREIKSKDIEEINKCISKKKLYIDTTITNLLKKRKKNKVSNIMAQHNNKNNPDNLMNDNFKKREYEITYDKRNNIINSHYNVQNIINDGNNIMYGETPNSSNDFNSYLINKESHNYNIYQNETYDKEENIFFHKDEEINEILQFLKKSNTISLMEHFRSEAHFSVTPLKLSTMYQFIDIYDNNVMNFLLNLKTQKVCSRENGWIDSKDLAKIRDILSVRSVTLRRAHFK
ncbi:general transcription factor 3C polypeptide 5, putative [Plasmodium reichenowi]|uniref:General transcription factor 3C polypeptide 5, putative n=1 Tax=Plasmodium reichenowi TaxID=5854 RepID=A0A151L8K0_PLARE|nr:general transcription factor 3C polypeptide 5, putative [Plasmodium reichenowi]KYN95217.1 general transcription factor 3C polypeptide 5, putative [Plasmodium reichenowi]